MTLEDLGNLGELIAAVGVIASFIFVGLQIRQNTKTARAQIHDYLTNGYIQLVDIVANNSEVFSAGMVALGESQEEFSKMSDADRLIFTSTMFGLFKHYEHMYLQHEEGLLDTKIWLPWSEHIRMYYHQPGVKNWWRMRRLAFLPSFREYLETSEKSDMPSISDLNSSAS